MNIYCKNCEHACSPKATACPECGHPLAHVAERKKPVAWVWGFLMVFGVVGVLASGLTCMKAIGDNDHGSATGGMLVFFASLGVFGIGRIGQAIQER